MDGSMSKYGMCNLSRKSSLCTTHVESFWGYFYILQAQAIKLPPTVTLGMEQFLATLNVNVGHAYQNIRWKRSNWNFGEMNFIKWSAQGWYGIQYTSSLFIHDIWITYISPLHHQIYLLGTLANFCSNPLELTGHIYMHILKVALFRHRKHT